MNCSLRVNLKRLYYAAFTLLLISISSNLSFAQMNSLKKLKENAKQLNKERLTTKPADSLFVNNTITAEELSKELLGKNKNKPLVMHVGFEYMYNSIHIPGAIYAGQASSKEGINTLKDKVKSLKPSQNIVIYCGCCRFSHCPNVKPAYEELKELGFTNVKVLYLPDSFEADWKAKGYAVEGKRSLKKEAK